MDWRRFLSQIPANDYIFQKEPYEELIQRAALMLDRADIVLIGAGAGLSEAAGLSYGGKRFTDNFREFIRKYGREYMRDMYSAGFYPYPTEEEKWGYWSKHSYMNRIEPGPLPLYCELYRAMKEKKHFVLTTNVDHQFWKAGFQDEDIFATQGDYGLIQCAKGCHPKTYNALSLFEQMNRVRYDCRIPTKLVPKCPVCGGPMAMHLRCDQYFVEDRNWHQAAARYEEFAEKNADKKVLLMELGVGFNTPTIIRFPFEKMVRENNKWSLLRLNLTDSMIPASLKERAVGIEGDMADSIHDTLSLLGRKDTEAQI